LAHKANFAECPLHNLPSIARCFAIYSERHNFSGDTPTCFLASKTEHIARFLLGKNAEESSTTFFEPSKM
jgi:hypothetical protein